MELSLVKHSACWDKKLRELQSRNFTSFWNCCICFNSSAGQPFLKQLYLKSAAFHYLVLYKLK